MNISFYEPWELENRMEKEYDKIVKHYEKCLELHGDSHLGVDWPNLTDVETRYKVMLDMVFWKEKKNERTIDLLDFGCGASHLYEYLLKSGHQHIHYSGLDISEKFINLCKSKFPAVEYYCLDILDSNTSIRNFDYIVLNGVFTEKRELPFEEMLRYFQQMITKVMTICNKGIAFNVMSKHVDWEREDLFHLPFDVLGHFLCKHVTRNFIIRNDYGLYEYTVYVYK